MYFIFFFFAVSAASLYNGVLSKRLLVKDCISINQNGFQIETEKEVHEKATCKQFRVNCCNLLPAWNSEMDKGKSLHSETKKKMIHDFFPPWWIWQ